MIYKETIVNIIDNSGGTKGLCINISDNKKKATIGDVLTLAIKSESNFSTGLRKVKKIRRKDVVKGIVIGTKKPYRRLNGSFLHLNSNQVILVNNSLQPLGTRILKPVPYELRKAGALKILSLAPIIV